MLLLVKEACHTAFSFEPNLPAGLIGLSAMDDCAAVRIGDQWLALTTNSYVVQPPFFPGGDIGRLAISGTVNNLAMMGATAALGLTCSLIIEDGFPRRDLDRILASMRLACDEAHARVITGDTKVMGLGEVDRIVINTAGIGLTPYIIRDCTLGAGDRIIVTGTLGDHAVAVMATRHGLALDTPLLSDVAPINGLIRAALAGDPRAITAMKNPTRGGVAGALQEMASKSRVGIRIDELALPVNPETRRVSERVGIDPLMIANEGKAVIGVKAAFADGVLQALRAHPLGRDAAIIGICTSDRPGMVVLNTGLGQRLIAEPEGEPLPRIC